MTNWTESDVSDQSGHPVRVDSSPRSKDRDVARRLWEVSEELTGVVYDFARA